MSDEKKFPIVTVRTPEELDRAEHEVAIRFRGDTLRLRFSDTTAWIWLDGYSEWPIAAVDTWRLTENELEENRAPRQLHLFSPKQLEDVVATVQLHEVPRIDLDYEFAVMAPGYPDHTKQEPRGSLPPHARLTLKVLKEWS